MDSLPLIVASVVLSAVLSAAAYRFRCLTKDGAVASFLVGSCVGVLSSVNAFFLLTAFTVAGFTATLKGLESKAARGLQEGKHGERTWKNVAGVGLPPCMVAALDAAGLLDQTAFAILFVSTIAVAGADTIASEIGVKDPKVYMITTGKRVEPGVNGGVSLLGTGVSTVAAFAIAVLGWYAITGSLDVLLLIPFAAGVFGNILDSLFGALLENKGRISKYGNNCSTALIAAFAGLAVYMALP